MSRDTIFEASERNKRLFDVSLVREYSQATTMTLHRVNHHRRRWIFSRGEDTERHGRPVWGLIWYQNSDGGGDVVICRLGKAAGSKLITGGGPFSSDSATLRFSPPPPVPSPPPLKPLSDATPPRLFHLRVCQPMDPRYKTSGPLSDVYTGGERRRYQRGFSIIERLAPTF